MKAQPTKWAIAFPDRSMSVERVDELYGTSCLCCRPFHGLEIYAHSNLGFRCASPQALRSRPPPRAKEPSALMRLIEVYATTVIDKLKFAGHI
jgi:hypothetical protein